MIRYLLEKEFRQIFRNPFLPRLVIIFPCITLLVMPWAADFEVRNIRLASVDSDMSYNSRRLTEKVFSSGYFIRSGSGAVYSHEDAMRDIEKGRADAVLEIPSGFGSALAGGGSAVVYVASDAVNSTRAGLAVSYLGAIVDDYMTESSSLPGAGKLVLPEIIPLYRFNNSLDYKTFMVPALMVMLVTMLCGFLPALNIVGEKEAGTLEQINVTPVKKHIYIISKLIPYWIIGFVVITIGFLLARLVYSLVPAGKLHVLYIFTAVYVLTVSGLGLVISNYSGTMQQAMFVMYFFILILILISGLFTPVDSMPEWARMITSLNPLRYYIEAMRSVYLKGSGIEDLYKQLLALFLFAVSFNAWAVASYRKKS